MFVKQEKYQFHMGAPVSYLGTMYLCPEGTPELFKDEEASFRRPLTVASLVK